jgi:hypothetical protein
MLATNGALLQVIAGSVLVQKRSQLGCGEPKAFGLIGWGLGSDRFKDNRCSIEIPGSLVCPSQLGSFPDRRIGKKATKSSSDDA